MFNIHTIGGGGGSPFEFNGAYKGATLQKIWVWVGGSTIKAVKVQLTNGGSEQFGRPSGTCSEFTFEDGEHFSSLSMWGNGIGTRLGAIKFKTNRSREFFAKMTSWSLQTEYPINTGSGICVGVTGRSGHDIDCMGFIFINNIKSTVLTNINYPTLQNVKPNVTTEVIKLVTYNNNSTLPQDYQLAASKKISKKSSWSVTNKMEKTFTMEVKAAFPMVVEASTGFSLTVGTESTHRLEHFVEKTESLSFSVKVPPGKTVNARITIGRATIDLPYTGTVQITCYNGSVLHIQTSGTYKGVTYTKANMDVEEK